MPRAPCVSRLLHPGDVQGAEQLQGTLQAGHLKEALRLGGDLYGFSMDVLWMFYGFIYGSIWIYIRI